MYRLYSDIRDKLGEPKWHDENGVPRYCDFHPEHCGIYDRMVALLEIYCQGCERTFLVSCSWDHGMAIDGWLRAGKPADKAGVWLDDIEKPSAANHGGGFSFGDAPWHTWPDGGQCAGTTMTTDVRRVVEFWMNVDSDGWTRHPEHECRYDGQEMERTP